jgi:hypothetical protein
VKDADYLHQLSFASQVRDLTWADGLHLIFETFRTWWKDLARKMDLNLVNIEDIPCIGEAIWWLTNLGREEMPDAVGIEKFDYHPEVDQSKVVQKVERLGRCLKMLRPLLLYKTPLLLPRGEIR